MTFDEIAMRILVAGGKKMQEHLTAISRIAGRSIECPFCGDTNPKESNDAHGYDETLLCTGCGNQFDRVAEQVRQLDELDLECLRQSERKPPRRAAT